MVWGSFGAIHLISLLVSMLLIVGLHFLLRTLSPKWQIGILFVLSFAGISAIIFNLVTWNSPIEYLPLHMCSINAMLLPITVLTRKRMLGSLVLFWCLGAALSLIVNTGQADFEIASPTFWFFYLPHTLEVAIPILLFSTGLIRFEVKTAPMTVLITMILYTVVHFCNLFLNQYAQTHNVVDWAGNTVKVNYMFSLSTDGNVLLDVFWKLIPYPYWYMYGTAILIVAYFLAIEGIRRLCVRLRTKKEKTV